MLSLYYKFTAKSDGEISLRIGQYLAKSEAKIKWHLFPDIVYILRWVLVTESQM